MPDLNNDGRNEVALLGGSTNFGYTNLYMWILELAPNMVTKFGSLQTNFSNSGSLDKTERQDCFQIYAKPGKTPSFRAQKYMLRKGKHHTSGKLSPVTPIKDQSDFQVID